MNHHEGDEESHEHSHHAHDAGTVRAGVVTVSSSRSSTDDSSGDVIAGAFESSGHRVTIRELIRDDFDRVQSTVATLTDRDDVDVIVTTGGTGVTPDDVTVDAVRPLFEKDLPGFGEVFRRHSEAEIGTRVIATRATAGVSNGVIVFCLPGSEDAVRLGVESIILPEIGHLVGLATRDTATDDE